MGGNIFQNLNRITKDEFDSLYEDVSTKLKQNIFSKESKLFLTRSVKNKSSFGDMDIITQSDYLKNDYQQIIRNVFNLSTEELVKNGNVVSFKYKNFQIDLLLSPDDIFQNMVDYFSWNDLSNLMGRVTHKHGLKFGHDGTYLTLRDDTYQIGQVLVTKSTKDLCDYMGWDFCEWGHGFDNMEDAFLWLVQTPYFNKEIFSFENRNSESARRDKKRPNYKAFLSWIETQDNLTKYNYSSTSGKFGYVCREPFYTMICEKFPHVKIQTELLMFAYEKQKRFKEKFNGDIVSNITGLEFQELGKFMKYCRETFDKYPYLVDWIVSDGFGERHRELFINSLKWHHKNNQQYRESNLHVTNPEVFYAHNR